MFSEGTEEGEPPKPTVAATALPGHVLLRIWLSVYEAVAIDSRRNGGPWEEISVVETEHFKDDREPILPGSAEIREYRAQGLSLGSRIGQTSLGTAVVTLSN